MSEELTISDLQQLRDDALDALNDQSFANTNTPATQASKKSPSYRLDSGIDNPKDGPPSLTFVVQTKTGTAVEVAKSFAEAHPGQIRVFRRKQTPTEDATVQRNKATQHLSSYHRPLMMGQSISHMEGGNGTLGCFVELNGDAAILSASHVIARSGRIDLPIQPNENFIFQPGCADDEANAESIVAALKAQLYTVIRKEGLNSTDAAIAHLIPGLDDGISNTVPQGLGFKYEGKAISGVTDMSTVYSGDRVFKIGMATGQTWGTVKEVDFNVRKIRVPHVGVVDFENFVRVQWDDNEQFATSGDSGSIYVLEKDMSALALHVTSYEFSEELTLGQKLKQWITQDIDGSNYCSFGCSMESLQSKFDFQLV